MEASHTSFRSQVMVYDCLWGGPLCPDQACPSEALSFVRNQPILMWLSRNQPCTVRHPRGPIAFSLRSAGSLSQTGQGKWVTRPWQGMSVHRLTI
jgi:hypothetical protein